MRLTKYTFEFSKAIDEDAQEEAREHRFKVLRVEPIKERMRFDYPFSVLDKLAEERGTSVEKPGMYRGTTVMRAPDSMYEAEERAFERAVSAAKRSSVYTYISVDKLPIRKPIGQKVRQYALSRGRRFRVENAAYSTSDTSPQWLEPAAGSFFDVKTHRAWLFSGFVYVTDDFDLTPEDVKALVAEADNKRRIRLEKAHAVAAMAEVLSEPRRRQPIPQDVRILVWKRDGGRCVECDSQEALEFDHIIPIAMGGSNTDRNLQLLCQDCNRRKGATLG